MPRLPLTQSNGRGSRTIPEPRRRTAPSPPLQSHTVTPTLTNPWQEGPVVHAVVQADVQQGPVHAGLREHLLQPGGDAAGEIPVRPGPPHLHPEKERETPPARHAVMVR